MNNNLNNLNSLVNQIQEQDISNIDTTIYVDALYKEQPSIYIGSSCLEAIKNSIINGAHKINFETYLENLGSNSARYYKNGQFNPPNRIIAVVVTDYLVNIVDKIRFGISQLYNNDAEIKSAYVFNGKYWLNVSEGWVRSLLFETLTKMGHDPVECRTSNMMKELVQTFWNNCPKAPIRDPKSSFINLNNCTLEILPNGETKVKEHNKEYFLMYCLPYEYEQVTETNLFQSYLNKVLPDKESQIVLQELLGSIFIKNINLEKIGILFGGGSNGKSVLLKIIISLLGNENVSQMDLKSLTTDHNAANNRYHLMNKLLNFAPEINARGEQAHDLIKRMASSEAIQVKLLYQNTITITDYAKLMFNANTLPSDVEHSLGFFRRFLIIPFDTTITDQEKDPELASKIIGSELAGVLNWIIEGAQRLQKQKKYSQCKKSDAIIAKYKLEADVVAMFIDEYSYISDVNNTMELQKLFNDLKEYILTNGYKPITIRTFADRLRNLGFKTIKPKGYSTKVYILKV